MKVVVVMLAIPLSFDVELFFAVVAAAVLDIPSDILEALQAKLVIVWRDTFAFEVVAVMVHCL